MYSTLRVPGGKMERVNRYSNLLFSLNNIHSTRFRFMQCPNSFLQCIMTCYKFVAKILVNERNSVYTHPNKAACV